MDADVSKLLDELAAMRRIVSALTSLPDDHPITGHDVLLLFGTITTNWTDEIPVVPQVRP